MNAIAGIYASHAWRRKGLALFERGTFFAQKSRSEARRQAGGLTSEAVCGPVPVRNKLHVCGPHRQAP